jgi:hypothetical protein
MEEDERLYKDTYKLLKLGEFLGDIHRFPKGYSLYLPKGVEWKLDTRCAILDSMDVETNDDDEPEFAKAHGLTWILHVEDIESIMINAEEQIGSLCVEDILLAFKYYEEFDAFVDFEDVKHLGIYHQRSLREVIADPGHFPETYTLYLPPKRPVELEDRCWLLHQHFFEMWPAKDKQVVLARRRKLKRLVGIRYLNQIFGFAAKELGREPTFDERWQALEHYIQHGVTRDFSQRT